MSFFHKVLNIVVNVFTCFLCFTSIFLVNTANAEQSNQTILLTPEKTLLNNTLVTMGLPFAPGQLTNTNLLRVYDENDKDVAIFTKPTLYWHWKNSPNNTIRAVKVQFYLDKGANVKTYRFSFDSPRNSTLDIDETAYDIGTKVNSDPKKAGMRYPIVFPVINTAWLEQSQIIPPFIGMNNDHQKTFWETQFAWGRELDFTKLEIANWLFDRVSSLYKGCMRAADAACYREAFLSYRFWNKHIKREGRCVGGLDISPKEVKACDTKYVYLEPIKIHLALTGDDSKHDKALIQSMLSLVRTEFYYQPKNSDLYNSEKEKFTERAAGLSLLNYVNAYQLINEPKVIGYIDEHIDSLYQHQNHNPDNLAPDGSFRHSWNIHEGASFPGNGNLDDRRFSPWMIENILDALWQAHFIVDDSRIPEMIRFAGEAVEKWGFSDSKGYIEKFGDDLHNLPNGQSWRMACNKGGNLVLYSGSSTANHDALISTQNSEGWYSDAHITETIFSLAVAYYFETDELKSRAFKARISNIYELYLAKCGDASSGTKRSFNWGNRSNYWGTYLWVLAQKGESPPDNGTIDVPEEPTPSAPQEPEQAPIPNNYTTSYVDNFEFDVDDKWVSNSSWFVSNKHLQSDKINLLVLKNDIDSGNQYHIELNISLDSGEINDKGIVFSNESNVYYTARLKVGKYGGIYIYKHKQSWDLGGTLIANKSINSLFSNDYILSVVVNNKSAKVYLNGEMQIAYESDTIFTGKNNGIISQGDNASVDSFQLEYSLATDANDPVGDAPNLVNIAFDELNNDYWNESTWLVLNDNVNVNKADQLTLKNTIDLGDNYSAEIDVTADNEGKFTLYLLFNNSIQEYYTTRIYPGQWGGVYLYKHSAVWDHGGKIVGKSIKQALFSDNYRLKVNVNKQIVNISLDGELLIEHKLDRIATGKNVGLHTINKVNDAKIHTLNIAY